MTTRLIRTLLTQSNDQLVGAPWVPLIYLSYPGIEISTIEAPAADPHEGDEITVEVTANAETFQRMTVDGVEFVT